MGDQKQHLRETLPWSCVLGTDGQGRTSSVTFFFSPPPQAITGREKSEDDTNAKGTDPVVVEAEPAPLLFRMQHTEPPVGTDKVGNEALPPGVHQ